jgi:PKD repeat protein
MKRFLLIFLTVFATLIPTIKAQNLFNNFYSYSISSMGYSRPYLADNIIEYEDGFLFTGLGFVPTTVTIITKVNTQGDTLWTRYHGEYPQVISVNKIVALSEGFTILSAIRDSLEGKEDLLLSCFNSNGIILWSKRYGGTGDEVPNSLIRTNDGGYIIGASTNSVGAGNADFNLIKTDSLGDVQWQKTYGGTKLDQVFSTALTLDGGYLLCGHSNSYSDNYNVLVIKTDSLGNEEWKWHSNSISPSFSYGGRGIATNDKGYIISKMTQISTGIVISKLIKLDNGGKQIWEKNYANSQYDYLEFMTNPIEDEDGSLIIGGFMNRIGESPKGRILKVSPKGDLIWERGYFTREDRHNYIYDIKPTADGGYIFCGSAVDSIQKAWVVKTDCFGCDSLLCYFPDTECDFYDCTQYPVDAAFTTEITENGVKFVNSSENATSRYWDFGDGNKAYTDSVVSHSYEVGGTYTITLIVYHAACSDTVRETVMVTGVDEFKVQGLKFKVVPNPANQYADLMMSRFDDGLQVVIYDLYGKAVGISNITSSTNTVRLDLSGVAAGIYYCTLVKDNAIIAREKLVVVK